MFKLLKYKIRLIAILIFTIGSIFISVFSYISLKTIVLRNYSDLNSQSFSQAIDNVYTYMNFIEESSKLATQDSNIFTHMENPNLDMRNGSSTSILDVVRTSYSGILGAAFISYSDKIYPSQNVSNYPSLKELRKDANIENFLKSDKKSFWSIRKLYVSRYFNQSNNAEKEGMVTFMIKIIGRYGTPVGFLCIDIDPNYIYGLLSDRYKNYYRSDNPYVYILNNSFLLLPHKNGSPLDNILVKEILKGNSNKSTYNKVSGNNYLFLRNKLLGNNIVLIKPVNSLYAEFNSIIFILILINFIIFILSIISGIGLANSITNPLTNLYTRMKKSNI